MGAALAYYTLLSLAPLIIFIVAIFDLALSQSDAEHDLLAYAGNLIGVSGAQTLQILIENTHRAKAGLLATVVAMITLLFGSSGVFLELRESLNTIWDVPRHSFANWQRIIWTRLMSFAMVLSLGLLLLASILATTFMAVAEKFIAGFASTKLAWMAIALNDFGSFLFITLLFAMIFKFVPDRSISWRQVLVGSIATSLLFDIGKYLLAWYMATAGVGSAYGAAGSLVAFMVWIYYSAQIFFFGAVFTKIYADTLSTQKGGNPAQNAFLHIANSNSKNLLRYAQDKEDH
jgi:membrane protein